MRRAFLIAVLAAVVALWQGAGETARAELGHYDGAATLALSTTNVGQPRGETVTLTVPANDFATDQALIIEPAAAAFTPGCNKPGYRDFNNDFIVDAGETPCLDAGDAAGSYTWDGRVRVVNEACNSPLTIVYDLYDVAMPNNELDPRASTNIAYPRPEGSASRFNGWAVGAEPPALGGTAPLDAGFDTRADAGSLAIQNYPSYLLDLFDPDGPGPANPVLPRAVYGGLSQVAGKWYPFYHAQFAAGALGTTFAGESPHPYSRLTAGVGQPGVLVSEDPTAEAPDPVGFVRCSPSTETLALNATMGGDNRATNPAAGTHIQMAWQMSLRDLENDGYENGLDLCPMAANTDNPRSTAGSDLDGIDPACDPTPGADTNAGDHDGDGWVNGRDNCPLVANPTQSEGETAYPPNNFTAAFDGGPLGDRIGAACDAGTVNFTQNTRPTTINLSSAEANGHYHIAATPLPECYWTAVTYSQAVTLTNPETATDTQIEYMSGADPVDPGELIVVDSEVMLVVSEDATNNILTVLRGQGSVASPHAAGAQVLDVTPDDRDADGYCAGTDGTDFGACQFLVPPNCAVRHGPWTGAALSSFLAFDTDRGGGDVPGLDPDAGGTGQGIACPGGPTDLCPENAFDSDWLEFYVGSNPAQACAQDTIANNEPYDSWVWDFNDDTRANISDLAGIGPSFSKFVNDPSAGTRRTDVNSDGQTNLTDVTAFGPHFNKQCRATDGTFGGPQ
jgi:hypothetical protein